VQEDLWAARQKVLEKHAAGRKGGGGGGARESERYDTYAGGVRFDSQVQERIFRESLP
jgi:hypothetical protein